MSSRFSKYSINLLFLHLGTYVLLVGLFRLISKAVYSCVMFCLYLYMWSERKYFSGLAFPPLYFYNGGVKEFLATIKQHVFIVRLVIVNRRYIYLF